MGVIGPAAGKVLVTVDGLRLPTRRALVVLSAVPASRFLPPPPPPAFLGWAGLSPGPPGRAAACPGGCVFRCEGSRGPSRLQACLHPLSSGPWSSHTTHANHWVPFTDGSTEAWAQIHSSVPPGGEPGRCREEGPSPRACAAVSKGWGDAARGDGGRRGAAAPDSWRSLNSSREKMDRLPDKTPTRLRGHRLLS